MVDTHGSCSQHLGSHSERTFAGGDCGCTSEGLFVVEHPIKDPKATKSDSNQEFTHSPRMTKTLTQVVLDECERTESQHLLIISVERV